MRATRAAGFGALLVAVVTALPAAASPVRAGLFAGDPVALTMAIDAGEGWAIEAAGGFSPGGVRSGVLMLGLSHDLLAPMLMVAGGGVQPTVGLGLRLALTRVERASDDADVLAGVRVPVGLAWRRSALEVYVEAAPGADFGERVRMSLEGGVGIRIALGD